MGRWGLAGRVAAAFLLDLLVLTWFPLWGVRPRLLPGPLFYGAAAYRSSTRAVLFA